MNTPKLLRSDKGRSSFRLLGILLLMLMSQHGWSQSYVSREGDTINPRFYVWAGLYYPNMNTALRIDTQIGLGTEIGLEEDLELSEFLGVFRMDAMMRLTENSQLLGTYTGIKRSRRLTLNRDIQIGSREIDSGSNVRYNFDVDYIGATYRYNFFNEPNWSAGISGGLRGIIINTSISGQVNNDSFKESFRFTAPAVLVGIHGSAYLTPRLLARYGLELFYLKINDIQVNIVESNASVHYFIFKNVGLGLAYSTNNYRLTNLPLWGETEGKINFQFNGFHLSLTSRF